MQNKEPINENNKKAFTIFKPQLRKPNFILSTLVASIRIFLIVCLLCGIALFGAILGIAKGYMETAPNLDLTLIDDQNSTSFFYDVNGKLITDYKGIENRIMIDISLMPRNLLNAFVAIEDVRFYTHNGVDIKRIVGSFINNLTSSSQHGGSTITQQLIKNTVLTNELSYKRKIQEAYLAMQLETKYSKEQILESYLNTIYLGENYYGVQVAAQGYFKKNPSELTLRECAILAGLTRNPSYYNPRSNFYKRKNDTKDYAKITNDRADYVLALMYENALISKADYLNALNPATANVQENGPQSQSIYAHAHYVEYAIHDIVQTLLKLKNLENTSENRALMEQDIRTGGYHITLAIDTEIQQIVENSIKNYNKYPSLRDPSDKEISTQLSDGTYFVTPQPQAAAVVIDYRTGELKAIVGSRTPPTQYKTLNRATNMEMPIGSTIKPIAVYAPALELGYSPASVAYNMPLPISGWKNEKKEDTWPKNYGGDNYVGPQTFRNALVRSHNVPTAQILLNLVGVEQSSDFLLKMGVSEEHIDKTPFGLSLGSSGLTPLELTSAYATLANAGVYQKPLSFLGISDSNGNVIYDSYANQEINPVFRPSTAWMIVDMLKDVVNKGTASNAKIPGQTVAGKTGTNSDERGITFAGMTGWYASAIWIGHDNYAPLSSKTTSNSNAAPLWKDYMSKIHEAKGLANRDIINANPNELSLSKVTTCVVSGQLATELCQHDHMGYGVTTDYWYEPTIPTVYCQMHQAVEVCADSHQLPSPYCTSLTSVGVVSIPNGHPLMGFASNPKYGHVISSYLGTNSSLTVCPIHTQQAPTSGHLDPILATDAQNLIQAASAMLNSLPTTHPAYYSLNDSISYLQNLLNNQSATTTDVATAMGMLSTAMSNASQ